MKKLTILFVLTIFMSGFVYAQTDTKKQAPPMTKEEEAAMKAWTAYATPGEVHSMLAKSNGAWNAEVTTWMKPGAPPEKSMATCTNTMILGGRYQQSTHSGTFSGMPFEGISTLGYDNAKKKYISTWIDNMGTGIMVMEGTYDPASKIVHFRGKQIDPMTGKDMDIREEFTLVDDNTQLLKMFCTQPGEKEYQTMEIKFTRK